MAKTAKTGKPRGRPKKNSVAQQAATIDAVLAAGAAQQAAERAEAAAMVAAQPPKEKKPRKPRGSNKRGKLTVKKAKEKAKKLISGARGAIVRNAKGAAKQSAESWFVGVGTGLADTKIKEIALADNAIKGYIGVGYKTVLALGAAVVAGNAIAQGKATPRTHMLLRAANNLSAIEGYESAATGFARVKALFDGNSEEIADRNAAVIEAYFDAQESKATTDVPAQQNTPTSTTTPGLGGPVVNFLATQAASIIKETVKALGNDALGSGPAIKDASPLMLLLDKR